MAKSSTSKFENMPISKRLLISFGMIIIFTAIIMGFSIYFIERVGYLGHANYTGPYVSTTAVEAIRADLNKVGIAIRSGIIEQDMNKYTDSIDSILKQEQESMESLKKNFGGDSKLILDLEKSLEDLAVDRKQVIEQALGGDWVAAFQTLTTEYINTYDNAMEKATEIYKIEDANAKSFDSRTVTLTTVAVIFLICLFFITLVLAVWLSIHTTRAVVRPLRKLEKAADEMAKGNLQAEIDYGSNNELGSLANSMRDMIQILSSYVSDISLAMGELSKGNMNVAPNVEFHGDFIPLRDNIVGAVNAFNNALVRIQDSSGNVLQGSVQVSESGNVLAQGATEQAGAIEELVATISDIKERINNSAQNAESASVKAREVGTDIEESNRSMQEMVKAMSEISNSSNEISKIIKTIEDIASQTNLLSLNAAIEAARAGEAGKGFAVVAEEVRNLASESAEASRNSTALIKDSLQAVEKGMRIVEQTASSLLHVVDNAVIVEDSVNQISADSRMQADSILQISSSVDQISAVVEENSSAVEESAASGQELELQALELKNLVQEFKLKR